MKAFVTIKPHITPCCPQPQKEYCLRENGLEVMKGPYALLNWERNNRVSFGTPKYLLTIKPIKKP